MRVFYTTTSMVQNIPMLIAKCFMLHSATLNDLVVAHQLHSHYECLDKLFSFCLTN